ncbi:unnamed protein product [Cylindrotheca closterium]|uniref:Receptor expression-enhancing protein n=1 Tax=Cylindrotheca closterium TaxID=2856 RepID=A0AAD2G161_9STRA|nr:unnamed protein product [Cylindrotheca closterium]
MDATVAPDVVETHEMARLNSKHGNIWISVASSLAVLAVVVLLTKKVQQERDFRWGIHLRYWAVAIVTIAFLPFEIAKYVFSEKTVALVGFVFPIYESVLAVCTPDEEDDTDWLRYWTLGGMFFVFTEWVDNAVDNDVADVYWYKFTCFVYFWLYFPRTSGAVIIDERFTQKYLATRFKPLASSMSKMLDAIVQSFVNAIHLYIIWIFFMFLPQGMKRIAAVGVGTVYPFVSSVVAISTEEFEDDAFWLTYWSCYGILFISMDFLETWLGWIPGFYTVIILAEVYLMLPMFGGAEKIFRKILVPLFGLRELLMVRDAFLVKKNLLRDLPPERAHLVRQTIADFFTEEAQDKNKETDMLAALGFLKTRKNGKSKKDEEKKEASETTNLV